MINGSADREVLTRRTRTYRLVVAALICYMTGVVLVLVLVHELLLVLVLPLLLRLQLLLLVLEKY